MGGVEPLITSVTLLLFSTETEEGTVNVTTWLFIEIFPVGMATGVSAPTAIVQLL